VCERRVDPARVAIANTDEIKARESEKTGDDDEEGPRPVRHRANTRLGEPVTAATIYGRARRARLKAAAESGARKVAT
jgi:hypothetical protein